ncbi:rhamnulokinase [Paenibacillus sp. DS2015]|uniref:rhamnulokinase n=1 Tax=Paenibacillus sp. DS2015 TaxID=3373917 RepID=UPI003D24D3DC
MSNQGAVLAFDLGASSGRAIVGELVTGVEDQCSDKCILKMTEVHRFPNVPVVINNHLHWDIALLLQEVKTGIRKASQAGYTLESCGIDTWGVDFGLLDSNGELIGLPYHYRDPQTKGLVEELCDLFGRERLFMESGLQLMPFNTIYQLYAMKKANSPKLEMAQTLLLTPDLLSYFLTGVKVCEFTMATTTQLYNPTTRSWNTALMEQLGIPSDLMIDPIPPGTYTGDLTEEVCRELGIPGLRMVAVGSHDTESAAAAVPATSATYAYLVCGTWSLLGTEIQEPLVHKGVMERDFSNEGGVGGTYQLLKNIMGLWIVQECKRKWENDGIALSFQELVELADKAVSFRSLIDPDHLRFMNPKDMPNEIRSYCRESGQPEPVTEGEVIRCVLESLALRYRQVLEQAEELCEVNFEGLHMVGGGIQNRLLCQFTSNAIQRPLWAGPIEASAIGNIMVQLVASGQLEDMAAGKDLIRNSFPVESYGPQDSKAWTDAYEKYSQITKSTQMMTT